MLLFCVFGVACLCPPVHPVQIHVEFSQNIQISRSNLPLVIWESHGIYQIWQIHLLWANRHLCLFESPILQNLIHYYKPFKKPNITSKGHIDQEEKNNCESSRKRKPTFNWMFDSSGNGIQGKGLGKCSGPLQWKLLFRHSTKKFLKFKKFDI